MRKIINKDLWEREEVFNFFHNFDYPYLTVTSKIEISGFLKFVKKNNYSFYACLSYFILKAINNIKEFHFVFENNAIYEYDVINMSFSVLDENKNLEYTEVIEISSFEEFYTKFVTVKERAEFHQQKYRKKVNNICYFTCLPEISITCLINPMNLKIKDSIPRIGWGKYYEENNCTFLDVSIQVHHGFQDGYHISQMLINLQTLINEI